VVIWGLCIDLFKLFCFEIGQFLNKIFIAKWIHCHLQKWERRYSSTHSLISALDWGEWSASRPGRFTPRERAPGAHWIGGCVGPRAVLDAVVKREIPSPRRESNPRTTIVQPVAQRYTDWAITALYPCIYIWINGFLLEGFVDRWQCAAVMQRKEVTVIQNCSSGCNMVVVRSSSL
jgi:hypothetical protein